MPGMAFVLFRGHYRLVALGLESNEGGVGLNRQTTSQAQGQRNRRPPSVCY